jgi:hypothetical protein
MASYDAVCANAKLLMLAFSLDRADPNSMPVTRDLSEAKRKAILSWLLNVGEDGKPLLGAPKPLPGATHTKANELLARTLALPDPLKAKEVSPSGKGRSIHMSGKATAALRRHSRRAAARS